MADPTQVTFLRVGYTTLFIPGASLLDAYCVDGEGCFCSPELAPEPPSGYCDTNFVVGFDSADDCDSECYPCPFWFAQAMYTKYNCGAGGPFYLCDAIKAFFGDPPVDDPALCFDRSGIFNGSTCFDTPPAPVNLCYTAELIYAFWKHSKERALGEHCFGTVIAPASPALNINTTTYQLPYGSEILDISCEYIAADVDCAGCE